MLALAMSTSAICAEQPIPLQAGPLTMVFDSTNVFLRYIRLGDNEILRGINAPIRPYTWSTVAPEVSNLKVDDRGDSFRVTFDVRCEQKELGVDFRWKGIISGTAEGVVEFTFDGEAYSSFKRNRIGFCVLHGPSVAGQPWVIETTDGRTFEGAFPKFVSPHQPAKNLRAITHEVVPGIHARVDFEGEVFEMEDQRNWTDASFKTYCTPLDIPYPVQVAKGDQVSQKIRISLEGDLSDISDSSATPVLTLTKDEVPLPRIGLQVSAEVDDLTMKQIDRLKALNLDHLRVDLALSDNRFSKDLDRATQQAKALGVLLLVGLSLGDSPDFKTLIREVRRLQSPVSHWLVTGGNPAHFTKARKQLKPISGKARVGVTRITNFVDLNRARPHDESIEAVGFAINPQIHAFDNASLVESLEIHDDVVNSTRNFIGDRPIVIGPVTLCPQWINGEDPPGGPPPGPFPTYVDPRQGAKFAAAWTLGSIKYLSDAEAYSTTYFETVGWNGVMDIDDVSKRPTGWPSQSDQVFPVYQLLKEVGEFSGGLVQSIDSSQPLVTEAIALRKDGKLRVLIANLTGEARTVRLQGLGKPTAVQGLFEGETTMTVPDIPITLTPHAIVLIDRVAD
jgi:D-apionolactonase